jgi:hypothetical protein
MEIAGMEIAGKNRHLTFFLKSPALHFFFLGVAEISWQRHGNRRQEN